MLGLGVAMLTTLLGLLGIKKNIKTETVDGDDGTARSFY